MSETYLCCVCMEPRGSVLYICSGCKNSVDTTVDRVIKIHGMKKLLEVIIDKLGDEDYDIKLKENIARALSNYNERYKDEPEG